jgi:hypothetical protein
MFERAVIVPQQGSDFRYTPAFDFGQIAEALVFYDNVTLVGSPDEIGSVIVNMGIEPFLELVRDARISAVPINSGYAYSSRGDGDHLLTDRSLMWSVAPLEQLEKNLRLLPRQDQNVLLDAIAVGPASTVDSLNSSFQPSDGSRHQLVDTANLEVVARAFLARHNPGQEKWVRRSGEDLWLDGRLGHDLPGSSLATDRWSGIDRKADLDEAMSLYYRWKLRVLPLTAVGLMRELSQFVASFETAAYLRAEFAVDPLYCDGISGQVSLSTGLVPAEQISLFQTVVFENAKAIGAPVTRVSMDERKERFLQLSGLMAERERFSTWIKSQNPDRQLIGNYLDYIERGTWLDKMPAKTLRFMLFTGIGLLADHHVAEVAGMPGLGAAAGVGVAFFDNLILDRIREGWHPNQFVSGPLTDWVRSADKR